MRSTAPSGRASAGDGGSVVCRCPPRRGSRSPARSRRTARPAEPSATGTSARAVEVQQAQRVRRAVADVGVAADRRHGEEVDLGPRDREPDREGVVEARVAVDDQRQRLLDRPERRRARQRRARGRTSARRPARAGPGSRSPSRLALLVRLAGGGGPAHAADDARHDDDRDDVRDAVQELRRDVDAEDRQQRLRRVGEAEHERRARTRRPGATRRRSSRRGR